MSTPRRAASAPRARRNWTELVGELHRTSFARRPAPTAASTSTKRPGQPAPGTDHHPILMNSNRLFGILLLVIGSILLYFGLNATESIGESVKEGLTGTYTAKTTWFLVGGAAAAVVGAALLLFSARTRTV